MNLELQLIRFVGSVLPPWSHSTGVINRLLKPFYLRKERPSVIAPVWGFKMLLNPREAVDGGLLFYPHLYNRREMQWLRDHVQRNDVFVDVGAHIGSFSLVASSLGAKVIAIEANPATYSVLQQNVALNGLPITTLNFGIADRENVLDFHVQESGNSGGSSFAVRHAGSVLKVECVPLAQVATRADVIKVDVEGMEYQVLKPYLNVCHPRVILLEAFSETPTLALCRHHGYRVEDRTHENVLLLRE